jgi:hypothetical protein
MKLQVNETEHQCLIQLQSQPQHHVKLKELSLIKQQACAQTIQQLVKALQNQPQHHVKLKELSSNIFCYMIIIFI